MTLRTYRSDTGASLRPLAAKESDPLRGRKTGLHLAQQLLIIVAAVTGAIVAVASGVAVEDGRGWNLQLLGDGAKDGAVRSIAAKSWPG